MSRQRFNRPDRLAIGHKADRQRYSRKRRPAEKTAKAGPGLAWLVFLVVVVFILSKFL